MVNFDTIWLLSWSYLTLTIVGGLAIAVLRNFLKKKTTGTLLLFTTYFLLFISRLLSEIQRTLQLAGLGEDNMLILILITISLVIPTLVSIFLYAFGCRGLLADSEYLRTIVITGLSFLTGLMFATTAYGYFYRDAMDENSLFRTGITHQTEDIFTLSNTFLTILIIVIQFAVYIRLSIAALRLAKNSTEIVRKRGFQMIGWGLLIFLIGGLITGATNSLENLPLAVDAIIEAFRRLIFIGSYVMLYIGWTLPDWFRKRLRKKSWFATKYIAAQAAKA